MIGTLEVDLNAFCIYELPMNLETRNRGNSLKFDIFDCQQDQNVLGDKSPGMVVGHFQGQINYGAQTHSKCEQHQSMCWAARLQKAEKG